MASRQQVQPVWELPVFRESHQLADLHQGLPNPELESIQSFGLSSNNQVDLYSVKFYPYTKPGDDPVFAFVGGKHITICRLSSSGKGKHEVINYIQDKNVHPDDEDEDFYTCTWTKDPNSGTPLLCVAGSGALIKIIDATSGKLLRTLYGHGGEINDLAISPINLNILASASDDQTIRIWSLDPANQNQPCAAILGGDGHKDRVFTIAFHANGRYLLSGGADSVINLWTLPVFPDKNTGKHMPTLIHYPHFSTQEVHHHIVDCVQFHHDLILSKSDREDTIVLWCIASFSSSDPIPDVLSAPTAHEAHTSTRSAFSPPALTDGAPPQYTRLLQFNIPDGELVWMRFSLFPGTGETGPVLAFCNSNSKVSFWDLQRLEEYNQIISNGEIDIKDPSLRPKFLNPFQRRHRGRPLLVGNTGRRSTSPPESTVSSRSASEMAGSSTTVANPKHVDWEKSMEGWDSRYAIDDPQRDLLPHREEVVKGVSVCGRQAAWSSDGAWCVVVGSHGVWAVFQRWRNKGEEKA